MEDKDWAITRKQAGLLSKHNQDLWCHLNRARSVYPVLGGW